MTTSYGLQVFLVATYACTKTQTLPSHSLPARPISSEFVENVGSLEASSDSVMLGGGIRPLMAVRYASKPGVLTWFGWVVH